MCNHLPASHHFFSVGHWALGHPRKNLLHRDMCWGTPAQWNYLVIVCWQQTPVASQAPLNLGQEMCNHMAASHAFLLDLGPWGISGPGTYFIGMCVEAPQHNGIIWSLRVDNKSPVASQAPHNIFLPDFLYRYKYQHLPRSGQSQGCITTFSDRHWALGHPRTRKLFVSVHVLGHLSTMELSGHYLCWGISATHEYEYTKGFLLLKEISVLTRNI